jgi:hypothetical protein
MRCRPRHTDGDALRHRRAPHRDTFIVVDVFVDVIYRFNFGSPIGSAALHPDERWLPKPRRCAEPVYSNSHGSDAGASIMAITHYYRNHSRAVPLWAMVAS